MSRTRAARRAWSSVERASSSRASSASSGCVAIESLLGLRDEGTELVVGELLGVAARLVGGDVEVSRLLPSALGLERKEERRQVAVIRESLSRACPSGCFKLNACSAHRLLYFFGEVRVPVPELVVG